MGKKKNRKNKASKSTPAVAAATEASVVETAGAAKTTEKVEDEAVADINIEAVVSTAEAEGGDEASQYDTAQEEDDEKEDATTNTAPAVVETGTACDDDVNQNQNGDVAQEESTKKEEEEVAPTETTKVAVEAEKQDEKVKEGVSDEEYVSDLSCHDDNDVADEKESESETDDDDNPWVGTTPEGDIMLEETDNADDVEMEEDIAPENSQDETKAEGIGTTEGAQNTEDTTVNTENGPAPPAGESTSEVAKKDKSPLMGESTSSRDSHNIGDIAVGADKEKMDTTTQNIEATLGPLLPGESEGDEWVVVDTADASSGEGKEEEAKTTTLDKEDETNEAVVDDGGEAMQANPFNKLVKKIVARTCCLKSARNMA